MYDVGLHTRSHTLTHTHTLTDTLGHSNTLPLAAAAALDGVVSACLSESSDSDGNKANDAICWWVQQPRSYDAAAAAIPCV